MTFTLLMVTQTKKSKSDGKRLKGTCPRAHGGRPGIDRILPEKSRDVVRTETRRCDGGVRGRVEHVSGRRYSFGPLIASVYVRRGAPHVSQPGKSNAVYACHGRGVRRICCKQS